jgi:hypothetical protein
MKSMLAQALEGEAVVQAVSPDEQTIMMKGPLAEIYTRALDIAYAKPDPLTGESVMESQQMDVAMLQKLATSLSGVAPMPTNNFQTVYGVSRDAVDKTVVVNITKEITNPENVGRDFFLIIDGTQPGANSDVSSAPVETMRMIDALECLVESHGGKVFTSLQQFADSR